MSFAILGFKYVLLLSLADWVSVLWVCCITFTIFLALVFSKSGQKLEMWAMFNRCIVIHVCSIFISSIQTSNLYFIPSDFVLLSRHISFNCITASGDRYEVHDYCPVSVLPVLANVFASIVHDSHFNIWSSRIQNKELGSWVQAKQINPR